MLAISAAELLAGGEAGGGPVPPTVPDEEEGLLPVDVALYCAAYDGPGAWKVLEDLMTIVFLKDKCLSCAVPLCLYGSLP